MPQQDGHSHQTHPAKSDNDDPIDPSVGAPSPTCASRGQDSPSAPNPGMTHSYSHPSGDWKHLVAQAANKEYSPMQMVIRHLTYHDREGFRPLDRLDFRQGQREFVRKVMDIIQMTDPAKRFNQLENLDFQRVIYEFLKAYGTSSKWEMTDPRGESLDRGKSSLLYWDFLVGARQAQQSKRLKLEDHDGQEFDEGMRTLHRPHIAMKKTIEMAVIQASYLIAADMLYVREMRKMKSDLARCH
ncbi:hypothetical protein FOFC_20909 [Fusarium oxysporum]|nr:hypothetical protein FOFC_20909 [Fusarium oxysporum]